MKKRLWIKTESKNKGEEAHMVTSWSPHSSNHLLEASLLHWLLESFGKNLQELSRPKELKEVRTP